MIRRFIECVTLPVVCLALVAFIAAAAIAEPGGLQALLDRAQPGDVVEVGAGSHTGPIRIEKPVTLRGRGGVIDGGGVGTPLVVAAPGARVEGVVVAHSGTDIGAPDACIYIEPSATGAVLLNNTLRDCAFGIWVHETEAVQIVGNRVRGR